MNGWLKIALYSFIGIIIGSFLIGLVAGNGGGRNYPGGMNYPNFAGDYEHGRQGMGGMMQGMPHWNGMRRN